MTQREIEKGEKEGKKRKKNKGKGEGSKDTRLS